MNLIQKLIVIILTVMALSLQSTYAFDGPTSGVGQLVRAKLWHEGIKEQASNIDGVNSFKSDVNYPEELVVAVEILEQEKR